MKSVLVIDTPESCFKCSLYEMYSDERGDIVNVRCAICRDRHEEYDWRKEKPSWCPLRPLPEKRTGDHSTEFMQGVEIGRNVCLDEITGEEE